MRTSPFAGASIAAMFLTMIAPAVHAQHGRTAPPPSIASLPGVTVPIDLRADGEPLREVLDRLGRAGGFRVRITGRPGLASEPVRLTSSRTTVGEVLSLLGEEHQLQFLRRGAQRVIAFGKRPMPEGATRPTLLRQVDPVFSDSMLADCVDGHVWFEGIVTPGGRVRELTLVRPVHPEANAAARRALRHWEFAPATRDGEPVIHSAVFTITFRLSDERRTACAELAARRARDR